MQTPSEVIETWFRRVWSEEDSSAIGQLFVPDGKATGLGANVLVGPDGFRQFHEVMCGLLTEFRVEMDHLIESDAWASTICTLHARVRATGTPVTMTGSVLFRIVEGKITEAYNHWDFLGLFAQMGLLPENAFEQALRGERIG